MICSPTDEAVRMERQRVLAIIEACANSAQDLGNDTRFAVALLGLAAKLIVDGQHPDDWESTCSR